MSEDATTQITVDTAETVNAGAPTDIATHPAVLYLVALVTVGVLFGFGWVTFAVLNRDIAVSPETRGSIITTWNNLAVAAAAVWTSSSLVSRLKGAK